MRRSRPQKGASFRSSAMRQHFPAATMGAARGSRSQSRNGSSSSSSSGNFEKQVRAQKRRRSSRCRAASIEPFAVGAEREQEDCAFASDNTTVVGLELRLAGRAESLRPGRRRRRRRRGAERVGSLENSTRSKAQVSKFHLARLNYILLTALVVFIAQDVGRHGPDGLSSATSGRTFFGGSALWPRWAGVQCEDSEQAPARLGAKSGPRQQSVPKRPAAPEATSKPSARGSSGAKSGAKMSANRTASAAAARKVAPSPSPSPNNAIRRTAKLGSSADSPPADRQQPDGGEESQISITPRLGLIRVPADSSTMLKCLISSSPSSPLSQAQPGGGQKPPGSQKFDISWSRFMYDENVYEHLDTDPLVRPPDAGSSGADTANTDNSSNNSNNSPTASQQIHARHTSSGQSEETLLGRAPFDRQQQLRDFLARSRQETNSISELLVEASLSISPVRASDNASYYCTVSTGGPIRAADQYQARIDLVVLSRPVVQLERVFPSRDSRSALIHWLVLSDGNTPIKKTILMVRNDTTFSGGGGASSNRPLPAGLQESLAAGSSDFGDEQQPQEHGGPSQFSSLVIDSNHNQWQRIEIPDQPDLDQPGGQLLSPYDRPAAPPSSSAGADMDVISPLGSNQPAAATTGGQLDEAQEYYASRSRWNLLRSSAGRRRQRSFNLTALLPGVTYNFRLAAINDMGQSEWSQLTASMPNELPAQINEMYLLSRANDSLAIGWRRPAYDGAKTLRYEMQLFDLNRTLTLDASTNTTLSSSQKTNFMYYFVNLNAGTDYHFHVRACSRAGCSAYSSPKLLATTLDGEADEPLEVELSCEPDSGNVSVSWLPPAQPRGQLLNYSVSFESRSRFLNESGRWQVERWRSSMETADNGTLSLEAGSILIPNTNYSVRVCANNRSKHCGRLSQLTARSQCSTPPELPAQELLLLPQRVGIRLRQVALQSLSSNHNQHLQLELAPISWRNGTPSCIQVVLIRLPGSFRAGADLRQYLPEQARDITLSRYPSSVDGRPDDETTRQQAALAYLAEEIDPSSLFRDGNDIGDGNSDAEDSDKAPNNRQQVAAERLRVSLGDGHHSRCSRRPSETIARPQVFDGPLRARTFYTGFLKLIMVRPVAAKNYLPSSSEGAAGGYDDENTPRAQQRSAASQEILTRFSGYFEPVEMGDRVLELEAGLGESRLSNGASGEPDLQVSNFEAGVGNSSRGASVSLQTMASEFGSSLRRNLLKFYHLSSGFVGENARLERLADFIKRSSPLMQLLEVGILVIVVSLLLLFVAYLITLPAALSRRRKRRIKRQLNKHQEAASAASASAGVGIAQPASFNLDFMAAKAEPAAQELADTQQQLEYQPGEFAAGPPVTVSEPPGRRVYGAARECPIHSSPNSSAGNSSSRPPLQQQQQPHEHRQAAVHVCQPLLAPHPAAGPRRPPDREDQRLYHLHSHHHHHHNQQQHHSLNLSHHHQHQASEDRQEFERNCRTMRRQQIGPDPDQQPPAKSCLTLSHQANSSVLALAKKINKSIPVRLFRSVLECRLRNGWLKDEFEQLPGALFAAAKPAEHSSGHQKVASALDGAAPSLKLRPQLVVSRQDGPMSALISGNDRYDAGLLAFAAVATTSNANANANANTNSSNKPPAQRRIICAGSPLDADSVWDFWRLIYEQEVATIVMLTQTEDANTGELRCAQYWPTCDNEETTILSPRNEFVQESNISPAKFKIRQETLDEAHMQDGFMVRRLTLIIMAMRAGENEPLETASANDNNNTSSGSSSSSSSSSPSSAQSGERKQTNRVEDEDADDEKYVIVEREILQLQFHCWNTSTLANQLRLITFIRRANERHLQHNLQLDDEGPISARGTANRPMLVHCFNGLGRSGVFAGLSFVLDDLAAKLHTERLLSDQQQQQLQKLNLFQLVSRMRMQRDMIVSPYRFYELLYQLTANCLTQEPIASMLN